MEYRRVAISIQTQTPFTLSRSIKAGFDAMAQASGIGCLNLIETGNASKGRRMRHEFFEVRCGSCIRAHWFAPVIRQGRSTKPGMDNR